MTAIPRLRDYQGPTLLSYGFRPFFLFGALYAGLSVLAWLPMFFGHLELATAFTPRDWHVHEMLYGYVAAVVTGFLLTAIPNWTGRLPLQGRPLLALLLVWGAGRIAVTLSAVIGPVIAMAVDLSFLLLVGAAAAREILAGRNWRNLKVLLVLAVLSAGNATFHLESLHAGVATYGIRIGFAAVVLLIMLVGGRIVPSFTRNWLVRANPGPLPAPFGRFDIVAMVIAALAVTFWVVAPDAPLTGAALVAAAILHATRLARWAGHRTARDPLVMILHVGYLFVPVGFALLAAAAYGTVPPSAGLHAWAAGAVGVMTLAVMTRASLGHSGRALTASPATQAIYALAVTSALARLCAALEPQWSTVLLHVAAAAWAAAFLGFAVAYWHVLAGRRPATQAA
ncbi:MAG TPA: NnrS family protein [Beijerinckiaceae bacterium]|nr:NnrS family protein [Beijerinckiaceae bacterium]